MIGISGTTLAMDGSSQTNTGLYTFGTIASGTIPTTASLFAPGCVILDLSTGISWTNTGTTASPTWTNEDTTLSGDLAIAGALDVNGATTLDGAVTLGNAAGDAITVTGTLAGKIPLALNGGAASASGLLMGVGTTVSPAVSSTANDFFVEMRTRSSATSGDNRGLYWRHEFTGVGGGGETIRAFSKISAAVATARGAHISLDIATAGSLSGFGAAIDSQLMLGGAAYDDDITALNLEIYANASATVTGRTSMIRPVIQGDSTAVANVNANAFFLDLSNVTASASGLIDTDITALTGYGALRVRCPDGVTRYIPITTGS